MILDAGTGATRARGEAAARELLDDLIELRQDVVREGQELLESVATGAPTARLPSECRESRALHRVAAP